MRIGLVVECTSMGLEHCVCPKILRLLAEECGMKLDCDARDNIILMVDKKLLIQRAAAATRTLLGQGCQRIVFLWDENPPWTPEADYGEDRCWHIERDQILQNLAAEQVSAAKVKLVCIEREFETWLLHDTQLLRNVIGTGTHKARIKPCKDPVRVDDPKAALMQRFRQNRMRYNPDVAAVKFAQHLNSLDRLKDCDPFRYFAQEVLGEMPKGWKPYVYVPRGPKGAR